jgi:hypothetical protein
VRLTASWRLDDRRVWALLRRKPDTRVDEVTDENLERIDALMAETIETNDWKEEDQ